MLIHSFCFEGLVFQWPWQILTALLQHHMYALNGLCMHSVVVIKLCLISQFEATTPDCYQGCLQSLINDCGNRDKMREVPCLTCGLTMCVVWQCVWWRWWWQFMVVVTIYVVCDTSLWHQVAVFCRCF